MRATGWILSAVMMGAVSAASGQTETSRMVSGRVFDDSTGCPLKGASVAVVSGTMHLLTDANGRYRIANPPVGDFALRVTLLGFQPRQEENVTASDTTARVDFSLLRAADVMDAKVNYPKKTCRLEPADTAHRR